MEQKKMLWVVAAISVFVLIIFGFALVIYSPSKTSGTDRQTASVVIPGRSTGTAWASASGGAQSAVDPDAWVRSPNAVPGFDTEIVPAQPASAESLTALNQAYDINPDANAVQDNTVDSEKTINVRDLSSRFQNEERSVERQVVKAPPSNIELKHTGVIAINHDNANTSARPAQTERLAQAERPAQTERLAQAERPAQPVKTSMTVERKSSSGAARQKQTVVEYWIQTGSFSSKLNAENARKMLTERYLNAEIFTKELNGAQTYRVRVGPYTDKAEADYWLGTISESPEFSGSYVSRVTAQR